MCGICSRKVSLLQRHSPRDCSLYYWSKKCDLVIHNYALSCQRCRCYFLFCFSGEDSGTMKVLQEAGEEEQPPPLPPKQHVRFGLFCHVFMKIVVASTLVSFHFHLLSVQLCLQMNNCVIVILVLSFVRKKKNYALACIMRIQ